MDKDKLIEEMLKDMGDRNNTIDLNAYGRGLIDMYDRIVKNCSIHAVVGQSEQLVAFGIWLDKNDKHLENGNITETVKEYLEGN